MSDLPNRHEIAALIRKADIQLNAGKDSTATLQDLAWELCKAGLPELADELIDRAD